MRRGREIIGLPVIDLSTGDRIAQVVDLLCDPEQDQISSLVLSSADPPRSNCILPWQHIYSLGADAVTVQSREAITHGVDVTGSSAKYLGKHVLTTSGKSARAHYRHRCRRTKRAHTRLRPNRRSGGGFSHGSFNHPASRERCLRWGKHDCA